MYTFRWPLHVKNNYFNNDMSILLPSIFLNQDSLIVLHLYLLAILLRAALFTDLINVSAAEDPSFLAVV